MKFGDKLISLRKKHGLSQEELAAKLNVSRQSVSKWESNNTYPETDKIVQICNIFDCRMDDLINDKINDVEQVMRKNKNNLSVVFDSLLEFVTKSINMFTSMKFTSILRCVIELGILVICLIGGGMLVSNFGTTIIMKLFGFLPNTIYWGFRNIVDAVFEIIAACFSIIVIIHIFKIRYLDYYDKVIQNDKDEEKIIETKNDEQEKAPEKVEEKKDKKLKFKINNEPKIIIRDKHTTFAFLTTLSKIIVGIFKAIVAVAACCFVVSLVCLVACLVIAIYLSKFGVLFVGLDICLVAGIVINALVLLVLGNYIINKKSNLKLMMYIFLGSILVIGIGAGISCIGLSEFEFLDSMEGIESEVVSKSTELTVTNDMIIDTVDSDGYSIRIDDTMDSKTIKVIGRLEECYFNGVTKWIGTEYGMKVNYIHNSVSIGLGDYMRMFYDDLENKIFRSYYAPDGELEVVCNSDVARMLIDNAKKMYLFDLEKTDDGYKVGPFKQKIYLEYNYCEMEYDARTGEYSYDNDCVCTKEVRMSPDGELIDFDCTYEGE